MGCYYLHAHASSAFARVNYVGPSEGIEEWKAKYLLYRDYVSMRNHDRETMYLRFSDHVRLDKQRLNLLLLSTGLVIGTRSAHAQALPHIQTVASAAVPHSCIPGHICK